MSWARACSFGKPLAGYKTCVCLGLITSPRSRIASNLWSLPMYACIGRLFVCVVTLLVVCPIADTAAAEGEWLPLFDGKSLEGWEKVGRADSVWDVHDGAINGSGAASMLVYTKGPYKNFRYRAE